MISKEEVKHIAKLARLELTEGEAEKMQKDLSAILDYFELLKQAPKPRPMDRSTGLKENVARKDEAAPKGHHTVSNLMEALPDKKDGYIKVKAIL